MTSLLVKESLTARKVYCRPIVGQASFSTRSLQTAAVTDVVQESVRSIKFSSLIKLSDKRFHISTRQGRGESGCSRTRANRKCAPGLICDDDFYCILERSEFKFLCSCPIYISFFPSFTFSIVLAYNALRWRCCWLEANMRS